jgi:hypothetical protein
MERRVGLSEGKGQKTGACALSPLSAGVAGVGSVAGGDLTRVPDAAARADLIPRLPIDLFGLPTVPPRGRGRPRHVPTDALRRGVRELHELGLNQLEIARAIGISVPTMLLHYPKELQSTSQARRRWLATEGEFHE